MDRHLAEREMGALEAILARRSVRGYTPDPVGVTVIRSLLEAAVRAPTAMHEEPWAFVVVQDRGLLRSLSDCAKPLFAAEARRSSLPVAAQAADAFARPDFDIFHGAGTLVVICARPLGPFAAADCWLAAENLMLAACALGLGTCVVGSALAALQLPEMKAKLGIPEDVTPVAPVIVGHPAGETPPSSRQEPQILAWSKA